MTWIHNWRDQDHHALEVLLGLGKGYHQTGSVADGMGCDKQKAYMALTRLSWRKVVDENGEPTEFALNMRRVRTAAGHEVRIVTEKSFSRVQLQDSRTMHRWSRQTDAEADAVVRGIIPTLRGSFPIRTIRDLSELEGRAFGAVIRAFREGLLIKAERKRLDIDTLLQVNRREH